MAEAMAEARLTRDLFEASSSDLRSLEI